MTRRGLITTYRGLAIFVAICTSTTLAATPEYKQRFGLRFTTGAAGYTAIAAKSVGVALPFQIEGTYSLTNAAEVLLGFRGVYSIPLVGTSTLALPWGIAIGFRYYYNVGELLKAYNTVLFFSAVDRFMLEVQPLLWGVQWDINDDLAIFGQGGLGFLYGDRIERPGSYEANITLNVATGIHYHF